MNKKYDYKINEIYNILRLLELYRNSNNRLMAKTECIKCNKIKILRATDLNNPKQNSCMCQNIKHNKSDTKLYSVYHNMKDRCFNENCHAFKEYGGKGVTICDEWLTENGFNNFYEWSINNGYKEGLSIDRKDAEGDYKPDNCRWVTLSKNVSFANKYNTRRKANKGTYYGISPDGDRYTFDNANEFAKNYNLNAANIRDVANGRKHTHKKWIFGFINE